MGGAVEVLRTRFMQTLSALSSGMPQMKADTCDDDIVTGVTTSSLCIIISSLVLTTLAHLLRPRPLPRRRGYVTKDDEDSNNETWRCGPTSEEEAGQGRSQRRWFCLMAAIT